MRKGSRLEGLRGPRGTSRESFEVRGVPWGQEGRQGSPRGSRCPIGTTATFVGSSGDV